ncbi:hypothetical protein SAMN06265795_11248 [Noviherbaspirillum humi]|uniref:Uncharacterized protein n=1 Tax=Noviherbaspirillum humi TaxID=1688639 RepID=A0A239JC35_9BURK|nr:hypothetical protein [Noviherbaspirillum humi]SNT02988.1 hypothetical protein SAMN06265795_11248 [Noviherbaspirillum humi]
MDYDKAIRIEAFHDLKRFEPATNFYKYKEHSPEASLHLAERTLAQQFSEKATARELAAAEVIKNWAYSQMRCRSILMEAFPVSDVGDGTSISPIKGLIPSQQREIDALYEVYRRAALEYARILESAALIDHFQQSKQADIRIAATPTIQSKVKELPVAQGKPHRHTWDEPNLRRLWIEYQEPGMTQRKLAKKYGVTHQHIGQKLKDAKKLFSMKKPGPFDPMNWQKRKTR